MSTVQELKFNDKFNIVTAIQVNHYLRKNERIAAMRKYYNSLKKGGLMISYENFAPYSGLGQRLYLDRWKSYQLSHGKNIEKCSKHKARYNEDYFSITILEHLEFMRNCGFEVVEILWVF